MASLVASDAWVDCGGLNIKFYLNDGAKTALDPALFGDARIDASSGRFTVF